MTPAELIAQWDSGIDKPFKGSLIDWDAYRANPHSVGCMCAQGQALHLIGGFSPEDIGFMTQADADTETMAIFGITRFQAVLLRTTNDSVDGAPSVVLTDPAKIIEDQAPTVLAFARHIDRMRKEQWDAVCEGGLGGTLHTRLDITFSAARDAVMYAAAQSVQYAAPDHAKQYVARYAARQAISEIQESAVMRERGLPPYFLPLFGFADPEAVMAADHEA